MIIVTGSNGFIGKNLIRRFENAEENYDVIQVDKNNCDFLFDLEDSVWKNISKIFHFGAISDTTCTDIDAIYKYNIKYSINLFEKARQFDIPVVYASSASVYGNSDYQINPLNYYAMSKATVDMWVKDNLQSFKSIVGLRFYNVYGNGEEHKENQASPLYKFSKQAKETSEITIFEGSENFKRDFVWVENCIDCALTYKANGIYDVGTGKAVDFKEIAIMIAEKYGANIKETPFPEHLKNKYQKNTISQNHFPTIKFKSVKDYIDEL